MRKLHPSTFLICLLILILGYQVSCLAVINGASPDSIQDPNLKEVIKQRVVGLKFTEQDGSERFCSGFALDARTVLTAAHCFVGQPESNQSVIVTTSGSTFGFSNSNVVVDSSRYLANPITQDYALVRFKKDLFKIKFSVPTAQFNPNSQVVIAGIGANRSISIDDTDPAGVGTQRVGYVTGAFLRDGSIVYPDGVSACVGDSGGPAFQQINNQIVLVGIQRAAQTNDNKTKACVGESYAEPVTGFQLQN